MASQLEKTRAAIAAMNKSVFGEEKPNQSTPTEKLAEIRERAEALKKRVSTTSGGSSNKVSTTSDSISKVREQAEKIQEQISSGNLTAEQKAAALKTVQAAQEKLKDIRAPEQKPVSEEPPVITDQPELPQPVATDIKEKYTQAILEDVQKKRIQLENEINRQQELLKTQQEAAQKRMDEFTKKIDDTMEQDVQPLLEPFREDLEKTERERLKIEENYFENQKLVDEMETLLTDIQANVQREKEMTGLASIREPRIKKASEDAMARVGVIEAVMSSRNNQIQVGFQMIDRSVSAINADRQDQLNYYDALINFYDKQRDEEGNKILQLDKQEREFLDMKINILSSDLADSEVNAQYIKDLMIDPNNARIIGQSGVTLNDTPQQIQDKFSNYAYSEEIREFNNQMESQGYKPVIPGQSVPESQIVRQIDSRGVEHVYKIPSGEPISTDEVSVSNTIIGGYDFSPNTKAILFGGLDINEMTPSAEQATRAELIEKMNLQQDEPHENFGALLEEGFNMKFTDDEIQNTWDDLKSELGMSSSDDQESDKKAELETVVLNVRKLVNVNAEIDDIKSYVELNGYDFNNPIIQQELKKPESSKKSIWDRVKGGAMLLKETFLD